MKYQAQVGMEDSPVFWRATFNTKKEAFAYKKGFNKALKELGDVLKGADVYWCVVREKGVLKK